MELEDIDFGIWERGYGRKLSNLEKFEIKGNMLALLKVLAEEASVNRPDYCRGLLDGVLSEKRSMSRAGTKEN